MVTLPQTNMAAASWRVDADKAPRDKLRSILGGWGRKTDRAIVNDAADWLVALFFVLFLHVKCLQSMLFDNILFSCVFLKSWVTVLVNKELPIIYD